MTLIEVLVVCAIVAVLVAILLPAIFQARAAAQKQQSGGLATLEIVDRYTLSHPTQFFVEAVTARDRTPQTYVVGDYDVDNVPKRQAVFVRLQRGTVARVELAAGQHVHPTIRSAEIVDAPAPAR